MQVDPGCQHVGTEENCNGDIHHFRNLTVLDASQELPHASAMGLLRWLTGSTGTEGYLVPQL